MSFDALDLLALRRNRTEFKVIGVDEFLQWDIPPREHIIAPWLPKQGLAMVYAPRGIGKTYFALTVACSVATGKPFLHWQIPKPRGVLYLDGEMPAALMQERIRGIMGTRVPDISAPFRLLTPDAQPAGVPDLALSTDQKKLEPFLDGIELIIVDNISTLCRATKENDADAWAPVQEWALKMRASGRSVMFIHHAGKGGNQRGTSKREDILDTVIALQTGESYNPKDGAQFEVHFKKARGFCGEAAEPFTAKLSSSADGSVHWETTGVKASTYDLVVEMLNDGQKQQEVAEQLQLNKSNVSRYAQKAREEGKLRSCVA